MYVPILKPKVRTNSKAMDLEESITELVFTREGVTVRTPVNVPIKGKSFHEERLGYGELPSGGFSVTVKSVEMQEQNGQLVALILRVSSFETTKRRSEMSVTIHVSATAWTKYHYMNISQCRAFFPGYKVPFVLETDQGEILAHVSSAKKGTSYGALMGGSLISGLKKWYEAHPEIKVGSRFIIEAIDPQKRYRISILAQSAQPVLETIDKFVNSTEISMQEIDETTKRMVAWAQEKDLKRVTRADIKMFILENNMKASVSLEQILYRQAKLKYRYLPPWMRESTISKNQQTSS
jgi:hypothetical protein